MFAYKDSEVECMSNEIKRFLNYHLNTSYTESFPCAVTIKERLVTVYFSEEKIVPLTIDEVVDDLSYLKYYKIIHIIK